MAQLPAYSINNALINFAPLSNALGDYRQANMQNQQLGMEQERLNMQKQSHAQSQANAARAWKQQEVEMWGKRAMAVDAMPDDGRRRAVWQRMIATHGADGLTPEELDHRTGPKIMAAQAGMFRDPREDQMTDLKLQGARLEVQKAQRALDAPQDKIVEVGGRLVSVGPGGAREIYAPQGGTNPMDGVKGAPQGYSWVDPSNPQAGVRPLPGFEKPVPGDVAGKVAMMNMARQRIEQSRATFERPWGIGDVAKYGAANVPLAGDVGALSGDVGMALRDVRVGIEAALRTMTGAAAPEQEVQRYVDMFSPRPTDSKEVVTQKINGLMQFMAEAEKLVVQGRGVAPELAQPQPSQPVQAAQPQQAAPKSKQEYDALPPGTSYVAPDGTVRTKP